MYNVGRMWKTPELAKIQDLLVYITKGLSEVTTQLRKQGEEITADVNHHIVLNLFTTITNANFDNEIFYVRVSDTLAMKERLLNKVDDKSSLHQAALWNATTRAEMDAKAPFVGVLATENEDVRSLRELIIYGLKGLSAYLKHANELDHDNEEIHAFMQRALAATLDDTLSADELVALTLETGKFGVDGMALLDTANTSTYGNPEITKVNIGVRNNPGILISGHEKKI